MTEEEKQAEIAKLSKEVENIIKYSTIYGDGGDEVTFTNIGAASSAIRARCRKILKLKDYEGEVPNKTTELMKLAEVKRFWKNGELSD